MNKGEAETSPRREGGGPLRIRALDSMRGLAAIVVTFGHTLGLSSLGDVSRMDLGSRAVRRLGGGLLDGAASVDFFFVLSGFVLALPYVGSRRRPLGSDDFVLRRILRIMPTYWAGLVIALVLRGLASPHVSILQNTMNVDWITPLGPKDIWQLFALIFNAPGQLINGPIWSLQVEMRMSLLLPFVIAAIALQPNRLGSLAILIVLTVTPVFLPGNPWFGFLPLFVLGAVLADVAPEACELARKASGPVRGLVLLVAAALLFNRSLQHRWSFPDMRQEYLSGLASAALIVLVLAKTEAPGILRSRVMLLLGDMSYSLYLMHLPILLAVMVLAKGTFGWSANLSAVAGAAAAFIGSYFLYAAVERPSIGLSRRIVVWISRRRSLTIETRGVGSFAAQARQPIRYGRGEGHSNLAGDEASYAASADVDVRRDRTR